MMAVSLCLRQLAQARTATMWRESAFFQNLTVWCARPAACSEQCCAALRCAALRCAALYSSHSC